VRFLGTHASNRMARARRSILQGCRWLDSPSGCTRTRYTDRSGFDAVRAFTVLTMPGIPFLITATRSGWRQRSDNRRDMD
jgi:hypothetical protein